MKAISALESLSRFTLCYLGSCLAILGGSAFPSWRVLAQEGSVTLQAAAEEGLAWELGPTGSQASLRGLALADRQLVWLCGTAGAVLRSSDGGSSWIECGPAEFPSSDFRSIHAWDGLTACIASAGAPAVILKTCDGGTSWQEVFRDPAPEAFIDALKFWDAQRGIALGDPVDGAFSLWETSDGGEHWRAFDRSQRPTARTGEAAFAASNSALAVAAGGRVWIGTGGSDAAESRILSRESWTSSWSSTVCPLPSSASEGVFSIGVSAAEMASAQQSAGAAKAEAHAAKLVVVGGDYRPEQNSRATAAYMLTGGQPWQLAPQPPTAFCSAVVYVELPEAKLRGWVATGPTGSFFSPDGLRWRQFAASGFHVLAALPGQVLAAGSNGRFARLTW